MDVAILVCMSQREWTGFFFFFLEAESIVQYRGEEEEGEEEEGNIETFVEISCLDVAAFS